MTTGKVAILVDSSDGISNAVADVLERARQHYFVEAHFRTEEVAEVAVDTAGETSVCLCKERSVAFRTLESGRLGFVSATLPTEKSDLRTLVLLARSSANALRDDDSIAPISQRQSYQIRVPELAAFDLAEMIRETTWHVENITRRWPTLRVSVVVKAIMRRGHTFSTIGTDAESARREFTCSIRLRTTTPNLRFDLLIEVGATNFPDLFLKLSKRLDFALPATLNAFKKEETSILAIDPETVAKLIWQTLIMARSQEFPLTLGHVHLLDDPSNMFFGSDEEGNPVLLSHFRGALRSNIPGRMFRSSIEDLPKVTPTKLSISPSAALSWPKKAVLCGSLAGLSVNSKGLVTGTATDCVVLLDGVPTEWTQPRKFRFPLQAFFNPAQIAASEPLAAKRHSSPMLALEVELLA